MGGREQAKARAAKEEAKAALAEAKATLSGADSAVEGDETALEEDAGGSYHDPTATAMATTPVVGRCAEKVGFSTARRREQHPAYPSRFF